MSNLGDFFSLINEEKKQKEQKKKELIGEVSLEDLFASLSKEKKKIEKKSNKKSKEKEQLIKSAKAFESFLFSEVKKDEDKISKAIIVLEKELLNLKNASYKSIDRLMRGICSEYKITPTQLHNQFKNKHNSIPDEWVKQQKED